VIRNAIAAIEVYLLKIASIVLPLFFPKNVSAPPAMEPDRPADLPDWRSTITVREIANSIWIIDTIICIAFKVTPPEKLTRQIVTHIYEKNKHQIA
jgi:hypothetical protein